MIGFYDVSEMRKSLIDFWEMRHLRDWGKIAKFCAKITRNWKMFVEFIFKDQMVYKFAQE